MISPDTFAELPTTTEPVEASTIIDTIDTLPGSKHDLTGIPNRAAFNTSVQLAALIIPGEFAVVEIDIDDLGKRNTMSGHMSGDQLLRDAADVLLLETRVVDTVSVGKDSTIFENGVEIPVHKSGDEFSVILLSVNTQDKVDAFTTRLRSAFSSFGISASMGGRPHVDGEDVEAFLRDVDALQYKDKLDRKVEIKYAADHAREALLQMGQIALEAGLDLEDMRDVATVYRELLRRQTEANALEQPALFDVGTAELFE